MIYKQKLLAYMILILLVTWFENIFAFNSNQQELINNFFHDYAKTILRMAHPTASYGSSTANVSEDAVNVTIDYYSGWRKKHLSMQLTFNIGSNGILQSMQVNHDDALIPPFMATEALKNAAIKSNNENQSQEQKSMTDMLYSGLQNNIHNLTGEQLCVYKLNYDLVTKGYLKNW